MADIVGSFNSPEELSKFLATQGMGETRKAFTSGLISAGGNLLSAAAAGAQLAGATDAETDLKNRAAIAAEQANVYRPKVQNLGDIQSLGDVGHYVLNNIASSAPQMGASLLAGAAGGIAAGPVGAGIGAFAGGYPFNVGQTFDETGNAGASLAAAVPMTLLDVLGPEGKAAKAIAEGAVAPSLKTFGRHILESSVKEGITEPLQEAIQIGAGAYSGKDYSSEEVTSRLLNAAVAGATVGAALPAAVEGFGRARNLIAGATATQPAADFASEKTQTLGAELAAKYAPEQPAAPTQVGPETPAGYQPGLFGGGEVTDVRLNQPVVTGEQFNQLFPQGENVSPTGQANLFQTPAQGELFAPQVPASQPEVATAQAPTSDYTAFAQEYLARKPDASLTEIDQMYRGVAAQRLAQAQPELQSQLARSRQASLDLGQFDVTPQGPLLQLEESPLTRKRPEAFATPQLARTAVEDFNGSKLKGAGWRYATKAMEGAQSLDEAMTKLREWSDQVGEDKSVAPAKAQAETILAKYDERKAGIQQPKVITPVAPEVQAQVQAATPGLPKAIERATAPVDAAPKPEAEQGFTPNGRAVDQNVETVAKSTQGDLFGAAPINEEAKQAAAAATSSQAQPAITEPIKVAAHLDDIIQRGDTATKALGRRLKLLAGDTPIIFVDNPAAYGLPEAFATNYGGYDETTGTIYINRALTEADGRFDEALMHETTHAATVQWVQKARENPTVQDTAILGELDDLRQQIANAYPDDAAIAEATSSVEELLAYGLTNRDFQNLMKSINEPHNGGIRDLFTKFTTLLRKALGIPDGQHNAFAKFVDLSHAVLEAETAKLDPEVVARELGKTGELFWAKKVAFAADKMQDMAQRDDKYMNHVAELAASVKDYTASKFDKLKSDAGFAIEAVDAMSENTMVERFKGQYPELDQYQSKRVEQDAFAGKYLAANEKWASETSRLPVEEQQALGKLAVDVTAANVSPLKDWAEHTWIADDEKADARKVWQAARDKLMIWKRDKPKLYDAYVHGQKNIKEAYAASYEQLQDLMRRLAGFDTKAEWDAYASQIVKEGKDKTDPLYLAVRKRLDSAASAMRTIKGDYWPLRRDGNYVIMYEKGESGTKGYENGVQFAESETEAERIANELAADGYTVGKDYKTDRRYNSSSGVPAVVTELVNSIDANTDLEPAQREALKDTVYRSYIRTMGDESISAKLKRKNVQGASTDMLRAVSSYLTGSVAQTAKLKYDHQIYKVIDEGNRKYAAKRLPDGSLRTDAEGNPITGDYTWGKLRNSMMRRVVEQGAETSPFVHSLTQAAHTYYLGFSPAFLITNLTQPWMVGWPRLAAKYGAVNSASALAKATGRAAKLLGAIGNELASGEQGLTAKLKAISDPQSMFSADNIEWFKQHGFDKSDMALLLKLQDYGVIDFTQASSLLGYARGEAPNSKLGTIAKVAGTFGHYSEMMNRLAMSFAYQELTKNQNIPSEQLVKEIKDLNDKTNLDYTQRNRAPAFSSKGFLGKLTPLVLQFQQYSFQMMEGIYLNAWKALNPTLSAEERQIARRTMLYSSMSTAALAGVLGLPFTTALAGVINFIGKLFSDDNEPFDIRTELRNHMYDLFGETGQRMLTDGLFSAIGVNIQDRAGLQDLLPFSQVIAADTTLQQAMNKEAEGVWGPAGQMVLNGSNAVGKLFNGDVIGAFRVGAPTALKNLAKAYEANDTKHFIAVDGSPLPVQADTADVAFMALGFTPADLAAYRQGKGRVAAFQQAMSSKKSFLTDQYMRAVLAGDTEKAQSVIGNIQEFNAANPEFAVKLADIRRLQMSFNKLERGGLPLPPTSRQRSLLNELRFAQVQPEEQQQ